jgi:phytoene dehydrogenase-like protein
VERIVVEKGRATGVVVNGTFEPADIVLSNADLPYTYLDLLPPEARGPFTQPKLDSLVYTASAFMMYLGTDVRYEHLRHHNFFLTATTGPTSRRSSAPKRCRPTRRFTSTVRPTRTRRSLRRAATTSLCWCPFRT